MKELIIELLKSKDYKPMDYNGIASILQTINKDLDLNEIYKTLVLLENKYEIIRDKDDKVELLSSKGLIHGELTIKKAGFGFVKNEVSDVFVAKDFINNALDGDYVLVKIQTSTGASPEGRIVKVLDRSSKLLVGTIISNAKGFILKPLNYDNKYEMLVNNKDEFKLVDGCRVLFTIIEFNEKSKFIITKVKAVIGHINDVGIDILSIVYKYGFEPNFSDKAIREAKRFTEEITNKEIAKRRDLRTDLCITIDGSDAKDLDDAISLEILPNNNYLLKVSIADVSHYVTKKSSLDREAYERGTSVYLADRVVPMLPFQLSNGICSLLPKVNRLTQTCAMEFNKNGDIVKYEIYESIIKTKYRLTYDEVYEFLENDIKFGDNQLNEMLLNMHTLASLIRKNKIKRGMLDFNVAEPKLILDKDGNIIDIHIRESNIAHTLIEDFMIVANETVATCINEMKLPFIYRVHDKPNYDRVRDFVGFLGTYGVKVKIKNEDITSKDVQEILNKVKENHDLYFLDRLMLRTMAKAIYDNDSIGHFGLASTHYTHFTSPIRRYPDLIVHRLLRKYLFDKTSFDNKNDDTEQIKKIAQHCSKKERDAIEAEREVNDMKKAEYMVNFVNKEFEGIITSVTSFGMFVELPNTVEGLVHISTLKKDYYNYHKEKHILIGERTSKKYRLGDKVKIKVSKVNVENREIDFEIV